MDLTKEIEEIEFSYNCPYCEETIKVKLSSEKFQCEKCGTVFHTTVEQVDFKINSSFIEEDEDE